MTTKSQQDFEELFKSVFPLQKHDWFEKDSLGYVSHSTNNGFKLYLATRKQALEEAITICHEDMIEGFRFRDHNEISNKIKELLND